MIELENGVKYVGLSDRRITLFENVYPIARGMSYNAYVICDKKTALLDAVDSVLADRFVDEVKEALNGRKLDYIVIHHTEPDHLSSLGRIAEIYPDSVIVGNVKTFAEMEKFFPNISNERKIVADGDCLNLGTHNLKFIFAPMVHWPEVMVSIDLSDGTFYSADAFGTFGALGGNIYADEFDFFAEIDEARRYYSNIVGKYGAMVNNLLKKVSAYEIKRICPLHGAIHRETTIARFIDYYAKWANLEPETEGIVIAYGSIYGHTAAACEYLAQELAKRYKNVKVYDVSAVHSSFIISEIFKYGKLVIASPTYNANIFPPVLALVEDISALAIKNRRVAVIENGTWLPSAASKIKSILANNKDFEIVETITLLKGDGKKELAALAAKF